MNLRIRQTGMLLVAALLAFGLAVPAPSSAMESTPPSASTPSTGSQQGTAGTKRKTKANKGQKQQRSDRELNEGFWIAYNLIYKDHDYGAGIAKLHSLGQDDTAEIANLIGYASRKLGRFDDAKVWYERALAANPNYARTWSYYGMWHAEQGNLLKAADMLQKVRSICGTECKEYTELKSALEGTIVY
jgi:tetratricopeptide (TPR) repeat protein